MVIKFDGFPEDFSMTLVNEVKNKTIWAIDDPAHDYSDTKYQDATVMTGVCLPRGWCWLLKVYDAFGDGYVRGMSNDAFCFSFPHLREMRSLLAA
jgi:hypothetical protein